MTDIEKVLITAADLIDKGFTKEEAARDQNGKIVSPFSPDACRFCALGAIQLATYLSGNEEIVTDDQNKIWFSAIRAVRDRARETGVVPDAFFIAFQSPSSFLYNWNDSPEVTGADVAALFRDTASHIEKDAA